MNLPMVLSMTVISIIAGCAVSILGYYTTWRYKSCTCMSVGVKLLTTLKADSGSDKWIGYQDLYGIGTGLGMRLPLVAV
jgi:hypothetical protein